MADQTAQLPPVGIGMIGAGTIGGGVAQHFREHAALYEQRLGRRVELRRVLARDKPADDVMAVLPDDVWTNDVDAFFATEDMAIVIEVAGGKGVISDFVRRAITMGKHVVTANKALLAAEGTELFTLAKDHGVTIGFEASCGGGIPIILALTQGLVSNRIEKLYGILNGTCNYILTQMTQAGQPYADALADAQKLGYAEADPTLDVNGQDSAQKLAILASLAFGGRVPADQVACVGIDGLDLADVGYGAELGYEIKLLAIAERVNGEDAPASEPAKVSLRVEPCFIAKSEQIAQVHGSFNALSVFAKYRGHTLYYGRGAGREPTAGAVVADALSIVSGWYPHAFSSMNLWGLQTPVDIVDPDDVEARFYLRLHALDEPGTFARVCSAIGDAGISISAVLQHENDAGQYVPVVITTHEAKQGAMRRAIEQIKAMSVIEGEPVCIQIIDVPEG